LRDDKSLQIFLQNFRIQEYLLFSLLGITGAILAVNFISEQAATDFSNWIFLILSGSLMILSITLVSKYGTKGSHGKSWILFTLFSGYWFVAESLWLIFDLVLKTSPWEYADDFFYITGYQLFFAFLIFYIKPIKKAISKKMIFGTCLIAATLLIPSFYFIFNSDPNVVDENLAVVMAYPILDAVILVPALIAVMLFFRGEVNFMMTLICLAVICQIVGDTSMLFVTIDGSYYPGHPTDILFLWAYVMLAFGLSNQIDVFKNNEDDKLCPACGKSYENDAC